MSNVTRHPFGKPYPPFGGQAAEILNRPRLLKTRSGSSMDGSRGTVWILTGPTARMMRANMRNHLTIVLDHGADPAQYWWGFLADHCPVIVWGTHNLQTERLVAALMRDGCPSALVGDDGFPPPIYFKQEAEPCQQAL